MANAAHNSRPNRESVSKRIGARNNRGLRARDGHCCQHCGVTEASELARGARMHLDHLTPRNHGGEDVVTNLVLACERCNSARGDMTLTEWRTYAATVYGLTIDPRALRAQARRRLPDC